jgi:hypothetical protein
MQLNECPYDPNISIKIAVKELITLTNASSILHFRSISAFISRFYIMI